MEAVCRDKSLSPVRKLVLCRLALYRNEKSGRLDPSVIGLATATNLSQRGIQKILHAVEAAGWIKRQISGGGSGRRNSYELTWPLSKDLQTPYAGSSLLHSETLNDSRVNPEPSLQKSRMAVRANTKHISNSQGYVELGRSSVRHRPSNRMAMPDQGRYEKEIADRLGTDGYALLMTLPEPEVTNLCRKQRYGNLSDLMLNELRVRAKRTEIDQNTAAH